MTTCLFGKESIEKGYLGDGLAVGQFDRQGVMPVGAVQRFGKKETRLV